MRIAIPIPTTIDLPYNQRSWPTYAAAITRAGGEPIAIDITASPAEILALAATCHGILLPGSPADVEPDLYGQPRDPATARPDPPRDAADYLLLDHAETTNKPVLGICYGLQSLNVWRGGSLLQDLSPLPVNHGAGGSVAIAHTVLIAQESLLAQILLADTSAAAEAPADTHLDNFIRLPINTSHHQAVASPGQGLRIVARCPDDAVIEALELDHDPKLFHVEHFGTSTTGELFHVEHSDPATGTPAPPPWFLLGVQWHPERSYDISPASRALFARLIQEAQAFHNHTRPA
jgi:putative glutamine amidotransferase